MAEFIVVFLLSNKLGSYIFSGFKMEYLIVPVTPGFYS